MLALGFFLPLVLIALTMSWHNEDIRNICLALLFTWAVSNTLALTVGFEYRPVIYPVLQVVIGLTAAGAWLVARFTPEPLHVKSGRIIAIAIVAFAMFNCSASVNYLLETAPGRSDRYLFVLLTNISFGAECVLAGGWGLRDAWIRAAGVGRVLRRARRDPEPAVGVTATGAD